MKFILTKELGRLCKWLRILGLDAIYYNEDNQGRLLVEALRGNRIILTRNARMSEGRGINILQIHSDMLQEQLRQVTQELKIEPNAALMFTRCTLCNEVLGAIEKDKVQTRVPAYVFQTQTYFLECALCKRIYWHGTHWGNVQETLKGMIR